MKDQTNTTIVAVAQTALAALIILGLHWGGSYLSPGWLSWGLAVPAWIILAITAAVRLCDITAIGKRWFVRRMGMIFICSAAVTLIMAPILGYTLAFPTWRTLVFVWGFALAWLTTPNMPPWWKYISGEWKLPKGQQG